MRWNASLSRVLLTASVALGLCVTAERAPKYKVLHSFIGSDGSGPYGGVILDQRRNPYGTTAGGGAGKCGLYNCGVVFQLTPHTNGNRAETVLYSFQGVDDGSDPHGGVILDPLGNIYGTATKGDTYSHGTAFELTSTGGDWTESTLYSFCAQSGCADGGSPEDSLVLDAARNLYGTGGVAFELSLGSGGWNEAVLHQFGVVKGDGTGPYAGLILDAAGNLYGTTLGGGNQCGSSTCGTVYELTPLAGGGWKETILHRFHGKDGYFPGPGGRCSRKVLKRWC